MTPSERWSGAYSQADLAAVARLHPTAFARLVNERYEPGDVHWALGDRLLGIDRGDYDRLLVLAPPRHGKSELAALYYAAWFLGRHPDARIIAASYNDRLASHNSRQVRDIVASPQFRLVFPGVSVAPDAAAVDSWGIAGHRGGYHAAGVGGPITGFGADLFLIDDPIKNIEEADSALQRDKLEDWLHSVALTRLEPGGRMVITMTRWHQDDIAGRIMRAMGEGREPWEVLELPAISKEGKALWPERFDIESLERRRLAVAPRTWSSMYMQQPTSARGTIFERDWLCRFSDPTERPIRRYMAVDTAYKDGDHNDFSAVVVGEVMADYRLRIREVWRQRVTFPDLISELTTLAEKWNFDDLLDGIVIEDAASGISAYQTLRVALPYKTARLLRLQPALSSKIGRAQLASAWVRKGAVEFPGPSAEVPWLFDFEQELFAFPGAIHDDQVDAFVYLVLFLELVLAEGDAFRASAAARMSTF